MTSVAVNPSLAPGGTALTVPRNSPLISVTTVVSCEYKFRHKKVFVSGCMFLILGSISNYFSAAEVFVVGVVFKE